MFTTHALRKWARLSVTTFTDYCKFDTGAVCKEGNSLVMVCARLVGALS